MPWATLHADGENMGRRRRAPLVPEAEAALKKLRQELSAAEAGSSGRTDSPDSPMVEKFRALARRYLREHPPDPS
jgi:hypothetical protein